VNGALPPHLQTLAEAANAKVRVGFPRWLRPFLMRGVVAITLGRRVYLAATVAEGAMERIVRHELAHVRQVARLGLPRFLWRYVAEYVRHRRRGLRSHAAYLAISFEVEALAAEEGANV
jgi:hypothetical protein